MMIPSVRLQGASVLFVVACLAQASVASAQPTLIRNIDNPDLAPARITVKLALEASDEYKEIDSITVPAGKRLVLDQASVWAYTNNASDAITGIWLQVKGKDQFTLLDPTSNEIRTLCSYLPSPCSQAAYNRTIKMSFEAGETIHLGVFAEGINDTKNVNLYIQGHYVTP